MQKLIRFLAIDVKSRRGADEIWPLIEHRAPGVFESFYADVERINRFSELDRNVRRGGN